MYANDSRSLLRLLLGCWTIFFLASCGLQASTNAGTNQTGIVVATPVVVKTALTSCPPTGTARNAIMPPLLQGHHPTIVYLVNEGPSTAPLFGKLERYDITTGYTTEFMKLSNTSIQSAVVSTNGQWVLFSAYVDGRAQLRMIRIDGQDLQTLYCAQVIGTNISDGIGGVQWSPNQRLLAFDEGGQGKSTVYLLNMTSGLLYTKLQTINPDPSYTAVAWLDNTRLYLMNVPSNASPDSLYILDTSRGVYQNPSGLQQVFKLSHGITPPGSSQAQSCWDFDPSHDGTKLFISQCNGKSTFSSDVTVQPTTPGPQTVIFSSPTLHVDAVRALSDTTLLLVIANLSDDTSHNGLWKINTDGTGLTQLTTNGRDETSFFALGSHALWSNISRDGSMYALQTNDTGDPFTFTLRFASLQGGTAKTFATSSTPMFIVGWTTV